MIRLSMNVVSSAIRLLKYINDGLVKSNDEIESLYTIGDIDVDDLLEMIEKCILVEPQDSSKQITNSGKYIVNESDNKNTGNAIRMFLERYVVQVAPAWSRRIPFGRNEAFLFMTKDEQACFYEASLMNKSPAEDEIIWWDRIAAQIRNEKEEAKLNTGRIGERLTIQYEIMRTGVRPEWKAIDTNMAGYDVMSVVSRDVRAPLLIEVKSSQENLTGAFCHITSHEWNVSNLSASYLFYFWSINNNKTKIAILNHDDIAPHIPENHMNGEWESVKIPFYAFRDRFSEWREDC